MNFRPLAWFAVVSAFAAGPALPQAAEGPSRSVAGILARVNSAPDPPQAAAARELLGRPLPASASTAVLLEAHLARADAAATLGQTDALLAERRRVVELTQGDRNQPKHLLDLAIVEITAGNWVDAERFARAAAGGTAYHGQDVAAIALLARMRSWLGDVSSARTVTGQIESRFQQAQLYSGAAPYVELVSALVMWAKADTLLADGKPGEAERALKLAIKHAHADTAIAPERALTIERAPAPDATWLLLDLMEAQLARLHAQQGRRAEAEASANAMLERNLARYGRRAASTAIALATLGEVVAAQGRWTDAGVLSSAATSTLEASGARAGSAYSFAAQKVRIDALIGQSKWHAAIALVDELRGRLGSDSVMLAATERQGAWSLAMLRGGRARVAAAWLARLHEEQARELGSDRYETAETLGLLGAALASQGDRPAAMDAFARAAPILIAPGQDAADSENAIRRLKRRAILLAYIGLLHDAQGTPLLVERGIDAAGEALRLSDALRGGAVQSALAASAARALAGTPRLGDLIRREQDARNELALLNDRLLGLTLAPESRERADAQARTRERIGVLESERRKLLRDVESQFPSYADLVNPRPATIEQARKALRADEALVAIVSDEPRTFVIALAPDKAALRASTLGAPEIEAIVARLRAAVDPESMSLEAIGHIDLRAAHLLYQELMAPVEPTLARASDLTVVSDGSLARLPLSILPTGPPGSASGETPFEWMKAVPWLARRAAVTNAPSVNAFVRLRALPPGNPARLALAGFGDPQFAPTRSDPPTSEAADTRALGVRSLMRGSVADADYARLAPLPETRLELQSIAQALGADPGRDLFLGARASRATVRSTDLSRRRVVAFATHGLVPGDLPGLTQPALALSRTESASESPLLTLEDVLGLKLDADLVVLSACNTASGDGQGAEAVSGLGRGFFYAGSRALLATHWPVETDSARKLVSELFAGQARDPGLSRGQALRHAMLAVIDGPGKVDSRGHTVYSYAHPLFWAGYALYGDGGR